MYDVVSIVFVPVYCYCTANEDLCRRPPATTNHTTVCMCVRARVCSYARVWLAFVNDFWFQPVTQQIPVMENSSLDLAREAEDPASNVFLNYLCFNTFAHITGLSLITHSAYKRKSQEQFFVTLTMLNVNLRKISFYLRTCGCRLHRCLVWKKSQQSSQIWYLFCKVRKLRKRATTYHIWTSCLGVRKTGSGYAPACTPNF